VSDSDLCGSVCGRSARRRFHAEPCPYDVVVSLLRALQEPGPTPAAVEHAAATLPVTRFRPDLTPTNCTPHCFGPISHSVVPNWSSEPAFPRVAMTADWATSATSIAWRPYR